MERERERRLKEESRVVRAAGRALVLKRARPVAGRSLGGDETRERRASKFACSSSGGERATGPAPRHFRPAEARSRFAARTAQSGPGLP
jgi:hypothetical protein